MDDIRNHQRCEFGYRPHAVCIHTHPLAAYVGTYRIFRHGQHCTVTVYCGDYCRI